MRKFTAIALSAALIQCSAAPLLAAEPVSVESVEVGPDKVVIRTDRPAQYDSFSVTEPPRVAVELLDSRLKDGDRKISGDGGVIEAVRVEQYQKTPVGIARVVLQLARKAAYAISSSENSITVLLRPSGDLASAPGKLPAHEEPAAPDMRAASAATRSRQPAPDGDSAPADGQDGAATQKKVQYYDILASLPHDPVTLDYDATDVRDVLNMLAARINVNLVFSDDVAGNVTVRLNNVPFSEAFSTVLSMKALVAQQLGSNIMRINTLQAINADKSQSVLVTRVFPLNYIQATDAQTMLTGVIKAEGRTGTVTVNTLNNMVIVTDTLNGVDIAARILGQIDRKPQQVLIEAKIVEVNLTDSSAFGIEWNLTGNVDAAYGGAAGKNIMGAWQSDSTTGDLYYTQPDGTQKPWPWQPGSGTYGKGSFGTKYGTVSGEPSVGLFNFGHVTNDYIFQVNLQAALQKGKAKVLSDPRVTTFNNKEASINITTQIPYVTTTVTNTSPPIQNTTVNYIATGITLKVTPTINADGRITMAVNPTVSQQNFTVPVAAGGAPGVDTRTASTTVMTKDGATTVIGGLIYDSTVDALYKVPLLGDIPLLGWFFKKKVNTRQRIELLIFVTPRILDV
ncbi:MAG: type IV pilus secretin PilQ [Elusimicrobiales bacterium]